MEEYYSDWEYYTDDYYDDDPTVKQGAVAKDTETKTRRANKRTPRTQSSIKPDITSFQGVIWKTSSLERDQDIAVQIYEPGACEQVALLKNWREIFKSAQPALDKSRLRKRKAEEMHEPDPALADDEFPCEDDDDSSDVMSDIVSLDNITENGDAGDASNTTPELPQSPKSEPNLSVVIPVKAGRKRKAEAEFPPETNKKQGETTPRAKRVASKRDDGRTSASSGPVRRSTRQKK